MYSVCDEVCVSACKRGCGGIPGAGLSGSSTSAFASSALEERTERGEECNHSITEIHDNRAELERIGAETPPNVKFQDSGVGARGNRLAPLVWRENPYIQIILQKISRETSIQSSSATSFL